MEVLQLLPHKIVEPEKLSEYLKNNKECKDRNKTIIISQFAAKDLVKPKNKDDAHKPFDKSHYYKNPKQYTSKFHE